MRGNEGKIEWENVEGNKGKNEGKWEERLREMRGNVNVEGNEGKCKCWGEWGERLNGIGGREVGRLSGKQWD